MSRLFKALEQLKYDRRMIQWNYAEGLLKKEEYQEYLKKLPDVSNNASELTLEDEWDGADDQDLYDDELIG